MNKVEIGLFIALAFVFFYIGGMLYYEMATTIEEHPEIEEIGGPPAITDLRLLVVTIVVPTIFIGICLKMNPKQKEEKERYVR